jgi:hypothetical protein
MLKTSVNLKQKILQTIKSDKVRYEILILGNYREIGFPISILFQRLCYENTILTHKLPYYCCEN